MAQDYRIARSYLVDMLARKTGAPFGPESVVDQLLTDAASVTYMPRSDRVVLAFDVRDDVPIPYVPAEPPTTPTAKFG